MASNKIKNNLFVWGNSGLNQTDLAVVETNTFNEGFPGGTGIYADILNSALRSPTLLTSAIIDFLKEGPNLNFETNLTEYIANWDDDFPAAGYDFKYSINDSDYATFVNNLKTVIDKYLAYSQVQHALNANAWTTPRKFRTKDTASTPNVSDWSDDIDGTENGEIPLPSTIHATLDGNASSATNVTSQINGKNISNIFESDGVTAKSATKLNGPKGNPMIPVYFGSTGVPAEGYVNLYYENLGLTVSTKRVEARAGTSTAAIPDPSWNFETYNNMKILSLAFHGAATPYSGGYENGFSGEVSLRFRLGKGDGTPMSLSRNYVYEIDIKTIINNIVLNNYDLSLNQIFDYRFTLKLNPHLSKQQLANSVVGEITKEDYIYLVDYDDKFYLTPTQDITAQLIEISCNVWIVGSSI